MTRLEHSPWDPATLPSETLHQALLLPVATAPGGDPGIPSHSLVTAQAPQKSGGKPLPAAIRSWDSHGVPGRSSSWDSFSIGKMLRALAQSRNFGARQHPVQPSPALSHIPAVGLHRPLTAGPGGEGTSCEELHCRWLVALGIKQTRTRLCLLSRCQCLRGLLGQMFALSVFITSGRQDVCPRCGSEVRV